ncbi:MAG: glutamine--fructose-6-phosphate transaminase (isomerizing) [Pseudomonadota bacterium]|nr:glutamine--fructose-6-phosphate transaminase (isomerizing) [Pseudomonadota bacterium]
MCGIFAAVCPETNIVTRLADGLNYLSYRGYDSVGVCLQHPSGFVIEKALGTAKNLPLQNKTASCGMGHSRWATHGKISLSNAHPHVSKQSVAVVHNGIINNHSTIRANLERKNYQFLSDTDSEVIVHLIHYYLSLGETPLEALALAQKELCGRYAFVVMLADHPNTIYATTQDMPLMLGQSDEGVYIASDLTALQHCNTYARPKNKTPFSICAHGLPKCLTQLPIPKQLPAFRTKAPDSCRTLQEIYSQEYIPSRIISHWEQLSKPCFPHQPKSVLVIACGSSFHCGLIFKNWLLGSGINCTVEVASELKELSFTDMPETLIIAISQSGETADTLLSLDKALKHRHFSSIAITNTPSSSMAHLCEHIIPILVGPEIGVASTKAVTGQLMCLYLLLTQLTPSLPLPPPNLGDVIRASLKTPLHDVAESVSRYKSILCLGKRSLLPIALEFALKLKELTYIHAEAIPAGELKHGPLALIDNSILCIVLDDRDCPYIQTRICEIKARGGMVFLLTQANGFSEADEIIHIPTCSGHLSILALNTVCQLLAYHTAFILDRPIDTPRNLAKSVTVE